MKITVGTEYIFSAEFRAGQTITVEVLNVGTDTLKTLTSNAATEATNLSGIYTWPTTDAQSAFAAGQYIIAFTDTSTGVRFSREFQYVADEIGPINTALSSIQADIAALNDITATDVWAAATRTLTEKTGFELTAGERASIATAVEQAILNEGDGQQVLNAIVGAIGNTNVDEVALVAAIRADLERTGGAIDNIPTNPVLATDSRLDNLDATVSSRATPAQITSAQSAIQADIAGLNDPTVNDIVIGILAATVSGTGSKTVDDVLNEIWNTLEQDGVTTTSAERDLIASRTRDYLLSTETQSATPVGGIRSHTP